MTDSQQQTSSLSIPLPYEGLLLRDFIISAVCYVCHEAKASVTLEANRVEVRVPRNILDEFALAYVAILRKMEDADRKFRLFPADGRWFKENFFSEIEDLVGSKAANVQDAILRYASWLADDPRKKVKAIAMSLQSLKLGHQGGVLFYGVRPKIPAPILFKANYYAGKREFLPRRFSEAEMKLDIHVTIMAITGAVLSNTGQEPERGGATFYLILKDPGAQLLQRNYGEFLNSVKFNRAPEAVYRIASALALGVKGAIGIRQVILSTAGNRPTIISCEDLFADETIWRFWKKLPEKEKQKLQEMLCFSLTEMRKVKHVKERLPLVTLAHRLAQSIYLSLTSDVRSVDEIYRIARMAYATTGDTIETAIKSSRFNALKDLSAFRLMLEYIHWALK